MFDQFGNMATAEDINQLAVNLRKEGDEESIRALAAENGLDAYMAEMFVSGGMLYLCDVMSAALGKLNVEEQELQVTEILADWVQYIKARCFESPEMARAVRSDKKSLRECMAKLLAWSFQNQIPVPQDVLKAAGVTAGKCTLGIPGAGTAKKIITKYYLEG